MDNKGLKMAPEKTEALLVNDERPFQFLFSQKKLFKYIPKILLGEHEVMWKKIANQQVIARAKEAIRKEGRRKLVEIWQSRWPNKKKRVYLLLIKNREKLSRSNLRHRLSI